MILVTGVFEKEVKPFLSSMIALERGLLLSREYFRGIVGRNEIVVTSGMVGKVDTAAVLQAFIDRFDPFLIIHVGACGGVSELLDLGDMVLADQTVEYDLQPLDRAQRYHSSDLFMEHILEYTVNVHIGTVASGDKVVSDHKLKEWIRKTFNASALDMDSAVVGRVSRMNGKSFGVLKIVVDLCDEKATEDFEQHFPRFAPIPALHVAEIMKHHIFHPERGN